MDSLFAKFQTWCTKTNIKYETNSKKFGKKLSDAVKAGIKSIVKSRTASTTRYTFEVEAVIEQMLQKGWLPADDAY